jgi:hypothetical protein
MASVASAYGFQPISSQGGTVRTLRMPLGIANSYAANIFKFQPVKIVGGVLQAVTATTDEIFGIFAGCEFTPSGGRPAVSPFWPTGTTYDTGFDMNAYVWPAWLPDLRFAVQANGAVAQAAMGQQFNIVAGSGAFGIAAGSTSTGLSAAGVNATPPGTGQQGQFALLEFAPFVNDPASGPGSAAGGDAFTDLIVGVAHPQVVSGFQTSI